ncbi:MAG: aldehyde dehydrogenase family protein, partial [Verrucomicrobiaceae bacterium]
SYTHQTEFFGPVLGVMRFESLQEAITIANTTGFGLTSGLQSLDDREIVYWSNRIQAGNLYINKPTVGAIVLRQPFGGMAKSCFGPGMHAGGPNYIAQFMEFRNRPAREIQHAVSGRLSAFVAELVSCTNPPNEEEQKEINAAIRSYEHVWQEEFSREHDHLRLLGEDNIRRYLPLPEVRVRICPGDSAVEIVNRTAAALLSGTRVTVSRSTGDESIAGMVAGCLAETGTWPLEVVTESNSEVANLILGGYRGRLRFAAPERVPLEIREAAARTGLWLADVPVSADGRVELLWYLQEQSVSHAYHRYGNLGPRSGESRAEPA